MTAPASGKPTLDQRRAQHAWDAIQRAVAKARSLDREDDCEAYRKDYGREAKKLPMRIHAAGLGHALAFLHAKATRKSETDVPADGAASDDDNKKAYTQLLADVTDWVIRERRLPAKDPNSLIHSIVQGDMLFLRRATEETLAYLLWLVRFAEAAGLTKDAEEVS